MSFHSFAGRITAPLASTGTSPWAWASTETAATSAGSFPPSAVRMACRIAIWNADHQSCGCCSLTGGVVAGCGLVPTAIDSPLSIALKTTVQDWVDESTPATTFTDGSRAQLDRAAGTAPVAVARAARPRLTGGRR